MLVFCFLKGLLYQLLSGSLFLLLADYSMIMLSIQFLKQKGFPDLGKNFFFKMIAALINA